ncbi:dynein regulatory complex protein 9 isoform X2 [Neoarius graeffei]|uniref:dynein regulatory complex protein 9 isoform X2 n=1 Tax=Neoarius graeffei TaxID=443677 RepID=UPI00298CEBE7|nr:dynein regulatory complex protein 9 isoform X2 [Neoarius graeffei]
MLCAVDVLRLCAVLRDCADQLAVLGLIKGGAHRDTPTAALTVALGGQAEGDGRSEAVQEQHRMQRELEHSLMDRTISSDYTSKVQSDRRFAARLISDLLTELTEEGTFSSLIRTVDEEKRIKAQLNDIISRDKEDRLRIKTLQKQLLDIAKETNLQIQERDKMVAHLEDQVQEWKMKESLQEKYENESAELLVCEGQKLNNHNEKQLETEIELLKKKLINEEKSHQEMEVLLKKNQMRLEEQLESWMQRYDKDTEDKQLELKTLKTNKSNNLVQLEELAQKYKDTEQVIIEDRTEKEKLRKQLEKEQLQTNTAIKIQSWWRGTMVRKGLGPFNNANKPKDKKQGKKEK